MTEAFLDYRSPYVWHSRALNFNKQLIKKLNQVQKCKKQVVPYQNGTKNHLNSIAPENHRRNGATTYAGKDHFRHRLLEPLSTEDTSTSSSLAPSLSSFEGVNEGKEVVLATTSAAPTTTTTFPSSLYSKYHQSQHAGNKMARNYLDSNYNYNNTSRAAANTAYYGQHSLAFSPPGGRCPVHGPIPTGHSSSHLAYKQQHLNYDGSSAHQQRYSSSADLREYSGHHPHSYLSMPYAYLAYQGAADKHHPHQYRPHHYYPHHYYTSSQMYHHLPPSSYHHPHHLSPMGHQYLNPNPNGMYTSKYLPSAYHQQARRSSSRPYELPTPAMSSSVRLPGLPPPLDHHQEQSSSSRCKGHLIVLATILTVVLIGTLLGVTLAIIN